MRNVCKRIKKAYCRCINGTKGSISILLVLAVSPLLSLTLLLVEASRYQSIVGLMQELANSAAFSALAEYDSYLEERYGLLATSQQNDLSGSVDGLLRENVGALGNAVTLNSVSAFGRFSLGETSVLKQQILENAELTVPVELALEQFNLQKLLDNIGKALNVDKLKSTSDALETGADLMENISDLVSSAETAKEKYQEYTTALATYKGTAYTEFKDAALEYIEKKSQAEQQAEHDATDGNIVEEVVEDFEESSAEDEQQEAWETFEDKRDAYKTATESVKNSYAATKNALSEVVSHIKELPGLLEKAEASSKNNTSDTICDNTTYEWLKKVSERIESQFKNTITDAVVAAAEQEVTQLEEQITAIGAITEDSLPSNWTEAEIQGEYAPLDPTAIGANIATQIGNLITALDGESLATTEITGDLASFVKLINAMMEVSFLFDDDLDAAVRKNVMFVDSTPSMSDTAGVGAMKTMITAIEEFGDALTQNKFLKLISAGITFVDAVIKFIGAMITWVGKAVSRLGQILVGLPQLYNNALLYGYAIYNLPNRLSRDNGPKKALNGFSYQKIYDMAAGEEETESQASNMNSISLDTNPGDDDLFKAAYVEYLLGGFYSEKANQTAATFNLYMFRLVLDIGPVLKTPSVSSLAGPAGIAIKVCFLLMEAFIDTIMLVNGESEFLLKNTIYCSSAGIGLLGEKGMDMLGLDEGMKTEFEDMMNGYDSVPSESGILKSDYTAHLFLLLMLNISPENYLHRMQNIIQMECAKKYDGSLEFDLSKAYTNINGTVQYTMNPLFDLQGLTNGGLFSANRGYSVGY